MKYKLNRLSSNNGNNNFSFQKNNNDLNGLVDGNQFSTAFTNNKQPNELPINDSSECDSHVSYAAVRSHNPTFCNRMNQPYSPWLPTSTSKELLSYLLSNSSNFTCFDINNKVTQSEFSAIF